MTSKLEPAIWPRDTGQWILCFDRRQLIIAWMSNIKEVHGKSRLYVSGNLLFGLWPPCCASRRRRRRAYAPTSNTASHDNHEKINSWVSFAFLYVFEYGAPLGGPLGRRSSAITIDSSCDVQIECHFHRQPFKFNSSLGSMDHYSVNAEHAFHYFKSAKTYLE